jgi:hypothetical protein
MQKLSNRAIISRLYTSANEQLATTDFDFDQWQDWYSTVQQLSDPEKMVYLIVKMNQAVTNGGFAEFYEKHFGIFAPEIIHVLNEIIAKSTAEIVANTLSIVNPNGLLDNAYKAFVFNISPTAIQQAELHAQDIRYDQLDGIENLEDLLGNYLQERMG